MSTHARRAAILVLLLVVAACQTSGRDPAADEAPQAAMLRPTSERLQTARTWQDTAVMLQRYVAAIPGNEFERAPEKGDSQRLMIGTCPEACRHGPLAKIEPRIRFAAWRDGHWRSGEVIARITSDGPYPVAGSDTSYKFNIHGKDTVYWWVGRGRDTVVSIFLSTAPGSRPVVSDLVVTPHARDYWRGLALARWIWKDSDEEAWGTCDGAACCRSTGLRAY